MDSRFGSSSRWRGRSGRRATHTPSPSGADSQSPPRLAASGHRTFVRHARCRTGALWGPPAALCYALGGWWLAEIDQQTLRIPDRLLAPVAALVLVATTVSAAWFNHLDALGWAAGGSSIDNAGCARLRRHQACRAQRLGDSQGLPVGVPAVLLLALVGAATVLVTTQARRAPLGPWLILMTIVSLILPVLSSPAVDA